MKNQTKAQGCMTAIIVLGMIIVAIFTFFSNALNLETIFRFGFRQYGNNTIHLHEDYYCVAKESFKVCKDIVPIEDIARSTLVTFNPGNRFEFKGYISKEYVTWVAISFFNKNERIDAYAYMPYVLDISTFMEEGISNQSFRSFSSDEMEKYKSHYRDVFMKELQKKIHLKEVTGSENIQKIIESSRFKVIEFISSDENTVYYCNADDYKEVERLYHMYLGNNFKTNILNISKYDPKRDMVYKENIFYKIINSIYFKIIFVIFLLLMPKVLSLRASQSDDK